MNMQYPIPIVFLWYWFWEIAEKYFFWNSYLRTDEAIVGSLICIPRFRLV